MESFCNNNNNRIVEKKSTKNETRVQFLRETLTKPLTVDSTIPFTIHPPHSKQVAQTFVCQYSATCKVGTHFSVWN